jgi:uracil-DNA glycosylase family 4
VPVTLEELATQASTCTACRLAEGRTQVVFGMGDPHADLMFVGEGPGAEEDKQGLPFVGRSGQLLDRLIAEELGRTRLSCYVGNTTKCLRYTAMVQLGDGTWERIGRLVRSRYSGTVMSVDDQGHLVARPVTGWHESPIAGRDMVKLTYRSAKRAGASRVGVQLTADHEVMTPMGWVPAGALLPGTPIAIGAGLSRVAESVIIGSVLGDGHVVQRSAVLQMGHSARQREYAAFKAGLLAELEPTISTGSVTASASSEQRYDVVVVRTRASRAVRTFTQDLPHPKRVGGWVKGRLTPLALAIWFMDDGHLRVRGGGRRPCAELATCAFDEEDLRVLVDELGRLGLRVTTRGGRIHFGVSATWDLGWLIAPYVPSSMRYKVHPAIAAQVPFDPEMVRPREREVLWDIAEVEPVEASRVGERTVYCIDVDGTHNFVTSGGVVHNCRPPGNRDPKPDEVEACWGWLDQQIDLVGPKVIITLGNFASKKLLDTDTGITKLRGQAYPFRGGWLVPTFHPAAALRGGGAVLSQMRSDFVRAKLLLGGAVGP